MLTSYRLDPPALNFGEDGVPRSSAFDDVYFDKEAGLEETRYVFLAHNQLTQRFTELNDQRNFTIAETGFGTGLNFLCAWEHFLNHAPNTSWLHFFSVEKFPLNKEKLAQSLAMWPSLKPLADELIKGYPELCHGLHLIEFPALRTSLTLWFGEASEGLAAFSGKVDAWFLDGFAPSKNPDMWSDELFQNIQRLSHQSTTFATFTAAGIVRRGLKAHGFDVQKVKGFGHKREMMIGNFSASEAPKPQPNSPPWFNTDNTRPITKVLIIGSGIAGATTAAQLAVKGVSVELWEQESEIANGASGNEQGMLYPKLGASDTPVNRFYLAAYLYAHRFYQEINSNHSALWQHCGLLQQPKTPSESEKFSKIIASHLYPEAILQAKENGLFLPLSGWVRPKALCQHLLTHPNITLRLNHALERIEEADNALIAHSKNGDHTEFSHIVLCSANDQQAIQPWQRFPTKPIRGQVTQLPVSALDKSEQAAATSLQHVLCGDGYVSPALEGNLNFGATYDLKQLSCEVDSNSHQENIGKLAALLTVTPNKIDIEQCKGRAALRCTVADYTPIVGPVSSSSFLSEQYAALRYNAKLSSDTPCELVKGLYINIGHGSRGLVSAPLSANYIARLILDESAPVEQKVIEALHPNRFTIRQLKRGEA